MARQNLVEILLAAKNNASGPIKQVQGNLAELDKTAGTLGHGVEGLAKAAGAAGLLLLGQQAVAATADLSELGIKAAMLRESFDSLAAGVGQSGDDMLAALRTASRGAIADSDLILAANRAMLLGVAKSSDDMATLMDIATVRGRAMGLTVSQAFNDIVTGLGRGSALILDNLGIVVNATEANERYAASLGKSAEALSETEKKQALINAVLADTTTSAGATVNPFEKLAAATKNLREAMGEFINNATSVPAVIEAGADAAQRAADELSGWAERAAGAAQDAAVLEQAVIGLTNDLGQQEQGLRRLTAAGQQNSESYRQIEAAHAATQQQLVQTNQQLALAQRAMMDEDMAARMAAGGTDMLRGEFIQLRGAAAAAGQEIVITTGTILDLQRALGNQAFAQSQQNWEQMTGAIDSAANAAGRLFAENLGGGAGLNRQKELSDELNAQVGYWRIQGYTMEQINDVLLPGYVANIQSADRELFKATDQTKALSDATREAEQAFNDLKSKVAGVLQAALDPGVGVNPEDFLPREDAINENARRLADIMVNGFKGQDWLGSFKEAVPDLYQALAESGDPQTAAAQMLREFEAGLRPELIDKEAAKERVRQMLLGEQNLAELAQEIAAELAAEMPNVGASGLQSIVSQALGLRGNDLTGGLAAGQQYADGAVQAVSEQAPGTVMVATLTAQLKLESNLGLLRDAGSDAGSVWGGGFLASVEGGVPAALIELLVRLITPGVQAGQAVKATLEGAAP